MPEADTSKSVESSENAAPARPRRRLRKRQFAWAALTGLTGFAVVLVVGFALLIGREIEAPDWLTEEIELRMAEAMPQVDVTFGRIVLKIEPSDWSPRVFVQNVAVRDETGLPFASLGELSVLASFRAALEGKFLPKKIALSGALVKLRRARDGTFDLTIGNALQASGQAPNLAGLVERLDTLLERPDLARLAELEASSLTVLYEDARAGRAWTVDGGRMRLIRRGDNLSLGADFALLGGQDYATTLELSYDSAIGSPEARVGLLLADAPAQDIASQAPPLAWMEPLRAPISGALRTTVDADGALGILNATLQIGQGVVQPDIEARPIPFDSARVYFAYDPAGQVLTFDEMTVQSAWIEARAEGTARLQNGAEGWPEALLAQLQLSAVRVHPEGLFPEPVSIDQAAADVRVRLDPFGIDLGQMALTTREGQDLTARGKAGITEGGWTVSLDARAAQLDVAEVLRFWPPDLKEKTRRWIADNVLAGALQGAKLAFRSSPGTKPDVHLDVGYKDASVRFVKTLPPITGGDGYVQISKNRLVAWVDRGKIAAPQGGMVDVAGSSFEIPDIRLRKTPAKVSLSARSTITGALSLLDMPPFSFLSKAGQPVTLASGTAEVQGDISLALKRPLPPSEITFDITGKLRDVRSESLVAGRVLAAETLDLRATDTQLQIAGTGRIDAVGFEGAWKMPIGQKGAGSQLTGSVELSERFVDTFNIGLPRGAVNGRGLGEITIDLKPQTAPAFALTSNLVGTALRLDALGWRKPAGARGSLSVRGQLASKTAPPRVSALVLEAAGLKASGDVTISANGTLDRARFTRVQAGTWLDAPVTLTGRGKGAAPAISISKGRLDLRRLPAQGNTGGGIGGGAVPLDIALDRLIVTEQIDLTGFRGKMVSNGGLAGNFSALVNGRAAVAGELLPQNGRTTVRVKSEDAGALISAAGLLKTAGSGTMSLILKPLASAGSYDGTLDITNLRLREPPPALALLSAASGIGLLEQMDGRGLMFTEVKSAFRIAPERVTITTASAVGPSLGISVDGYYNTKAKTVDVQGVLSPFYALNSIGSFLTRRGEGLVGLNFNADGAIAAPRVQVNPLSIFTPGMFREIFRRPPPELSQ